jgi:ATP-binding cassette, subfamily B, bacterial PglK
VSTLKLVSALLLPSERRRGLVVLLLTCAIAAIDALGIASIMPFLAVLGNRRVIETNPYLLSLYQWGGFTSSDEFVFAIGLLSLAVVLVGALLRAAGQYAIFRFTSTQAYSLSRRLLEAYLGQPYEFFIRRNSADLIKRTMSDVDAAIDQFLTPLLQLIAYGLVAAMLIALLLFVDWKIALLVLTVIGAFYAVLFFGTRKLLSRIGRDRSLANRERFTIATEAFGGIKEVKLLGLEPNFVSRFAGAARRFSQHKATADISVMLPRYLIEAVAFGGALVLALLLMRSRGDIGEVLPILGVYALAGYRMLPAMQHVYNGVMRMRFGRPMVETVVEDLHFVKRGGSAPGAVALNPLRESIRFEDVSYRYFGAASPIFKDVSFEVRCRTSVGIVGRSGVGKTTLVDLLLGLLIPDAGSVLIDGIPLSDSNRSAWQRTIGYVPQSIFLVDASIAENIAFGVTQSDLDREKVIDAARTAGIHDFISELPAGYDTVIGERGVRLSGGQRQRIGIARALYRDPNVIVFDEATSALDQVTESAVMKSLNRARVGRTLIVIAHRLTTVRGCDIIHFLKDDKIVSGTFDELRRTDADFENLVEPGPNDAPSVVLDARNDP